MPRGPTPKLSPQRTSDAAEMYRQGSPLREVAAEFGVSPRIIRLHLIRFGVVMRPVGAPAKADTAAMADAYAKGQTLQEVADAYGVHRTAVLFRFERAGIKRRKQGRVSPHREEIARLRSEGVRWVDIAKTIGISTGAVHMVARRMGVS